MILKELLDILCCPIGKAPLKKEGDNLICTSCGSVFPLKDGILILFIDEAILPAGIKSVSELKCMKANA